MATCDHEKIETEIYHIAVGRKWQQIGSCSYCPECRKWTKRTRFFLDGDFFKTESDARTANQELYEWCKEQRLAWVAEHYPDHAPAPTTGRGDTGGIRP